MILPDRFAHLARARQHMVMVFAILCSSLFLQNAQAQNTHPKILIMGDSLSAEYGLAKGSGWVSLLEKKLQKEKPSWQIMNASISGETTAGGKARIASLLATHHPQIVIIELGANDALRGLDLKATENNLDHMIHTAKEAGAKVLLLGMRIPPNYGMTYTRQFFELYGKLAQKEDVSLLPFFLEKVAQDPKLFQEDRIHPNASAQVIMLGNVWEQLQSLLQ